MKNIIMVTCLFLLSTFSFASGQFDYSKMDGVVKQDLNNAGVVYELLETFESDDEGETFSSKPVEDGKESYGRSLYRCTQRCGYRTRTTYCRGYRGATCTGGCSPYIWIRARCY